LNKIKNIIIVTISALVFILMINNYDSILNWINNFNTTADQNLNHANKNEEAEVESDTLNKSDLNNEIKKLTQQNNSLSKELTNYKEEKNKLDKEIKTLESTLNTQKTSIQDLETSKNNLKKELDNTKKEYEENESERRNFENNINDFFNNQLSYAILGILFAMLLIILVFSFLTYSLYSWRIRLSNKKGELKELLTPENFNLIMENLNKSIEKNETNLKKTTNNILLSTDKNTKALTMINEENSKDIDSLKDVVMSFQSKIDSQEKEIKRLKFGYDSFVLKNYFNKLVNIKELIAYIIENNNKKDKSKLNESIDRLAGRLENMLKRYNIETIPINNGDKIENIDSDSYESNEDLKPKNEEQSLTICKVTSNGYRYKKEDGSYKVILPASVSIYTSYETKKEKKNG
tara:strand:- start:2667 stop:3884 length:1218 start_codon:yes stop_codon:yes gene_type:complete